jgi:endonuclease YncB( thermonuclease family)
MRPRLPRNVLTTGGPMPRLLLPLVLVLLLPAVARAEVLPARIVALGSGSAIAVLGPDEKLRRVKLLGVDAPERTQPFGNDALRLASEWLKGGKVPVETGRIDRDGRIFGRIVVDGADVAMKLIEAGLAWCDPADAESMAAVLRESYWAACAKAKAQRMGLWRDPYPTPPWEHRKIPQVKAMPEIGQPTERRCQFTGAADIQCDDGISYRIRGDRIYGSDGIVYSRSGSTISGTDGSHARVNGQTIYGPGGMVCRIRGRLIQCN